MKNGIIMECIKDTYLDVYYINNEMTGIQALEYKYPDKLPIPGQDAKMEFEYIKHGTTSLIDFFKISTGTVFAPYLNATRTEEDFCKAVSQVIGTKPNDNI